MRFEEDDSDTFRDTIHFQHILKLLGLSAAQELVIAANDKQPKQFIHNFLSELETKIQNVDGRCLVLGHYAGHAEMVYGNSLILKESRMRRQSMSFRTTLEVLWDPAELNFNNTDVVMIMDSCFGGQAIRGTEPPDRSVEILASVSMNPNTVGGYHPSQLARYPDDTFTSGLANEVVRIVGRSNADSISFSELVGELRRVPHLGRLPEYLLKMGRVGIRVPIPRQAILVPHHRNPSPQRPQIVTQESFTTVPDIPQPHPIHAIFKVHLSDTDPDSAETAELVQWIYSLNPKIGLELIGVFLSRSTEIFLSAPWHVWALLSHRPGFQLMCETLSPDLVPKILSKLGAKQAATSRKRKGCDEGTGFDGGES